MGLSLPQEPDWARLRGLYSRNVLLRVDFPFMDVVRHVHGRLSYLATPYTRLVADDGGSWDRGQSREIEVRTARWARCFAIEQVTVVSPILQSSAICHVDMERRLDPLDEVFWARWCQPMLSACGAVVIPAMDGWDRSRGVWREACWALRHQVPVYLIAEGSELGGVS